jgi:hypothetical protein
MANNIGHRRWLHVWVAIAIGLWIWSAQTDSRSEIQRRSTLVPAQQGDLAARGGSPTVRRPYLRSEDDPSTSNDETNDQPLGHFGTLTLSVCNSSTSKCYEVDAELSGTTLDRLYFQKGGWVDFDACELDEDFTGECDDENGRWWEINGEA